MESRVERGPTLPLPVDLYSWQVMELITLQECTGYHRHQQVDPWPKSDPKSDRMIFTYFHRKLLGIPESVALSWVDPPVGFVQKRINFGGTPSQFGCGDTPGPHQGGLGEVAQWQEDARLPNLCCRRQ